MKANELREKGVPDMTKELLALKRELFNLRMQSSMGEAPKPHQFKRVRRDIARVKTIISEKERQQ